MSKTNLEWLYEHDSDFAWKIDNLAWDAGGFSTSQPLDEIPWTHPKMREWLMAPHDGAHSKVQSKNAPTLSDLYGILSDGNAPETPDFAENPQKTGEEGMKSGTSADCGHSADISAKDADCVRDGGEMSDADSRDNGWCLRYDGYMTSKSNYLRISGFKAARALDNRQNLVFVKFMGGKEADCRVYAPKLDVCENLHDTSKETQKPRSREADSGNVSDSDGENLHVEQDTREKLEADVLSGCNHVTFAEHGEMLVNVPWSRLLGWLDRQAAITEREREQHWLEIIGVCANCNLELTNQIAELQSEIIKRDKGIERLKKRRDEAREQLDADWPKLLRCLESDYNIKASWDGLRKIWLTERAGGSAVDAMREFAARYEKRIAELGDELHRSYDAQGAKAEALTIQNVRIAELQEQVGKLTAERDGWRMRCGDLLDAAHAMQGVADAWDEEV